ncbi:pro-sigmaK processing inhibitor BofA family protein [Christensenellaceae bacterium OttesenSCG-928-L17]|nr:pro-sigmaK processing inhibitor BofA family protein [Christensenellaceae bacterium OttesenSCG-928-L17]
MGTLGMLLTLGAALLVLYLICMLLVIPVKWILRLIGNGIVGFLILTLVNLAGGALLNFTIPMSLINVLVAGIFGVPGVVVLVLIRLFL